MRIVDLQIPIDATTPSYRSDPEQRGQLPRHRRVAAGGVHRAAVRDIPGQFEGPLRNVAEDAGLARLAGVDISLLVGDRARVVLYAAALLLSPAQTEPPFSQDPSRPRR